MTHLLLCRLNLLLSFNKNDSSVDLNQPLANQAGANWP
jgi:hypothetical protein